MRCAVSCAVCASALPQGGRSDCRYCGARCRMRAYRIRLDAGGCRRADAQRRQLGGLRDALKQAGQDKAALQRSQNEAAEWAVLLEAEEAMLRAELTRLGFAPAYAEWPGKHDWDYWRVHARESLAWLAQQVAAR